MNNWNLENKYALVTGGSKGIGKAIVNEFLELGASVFFLARDEKQTEAALASFGESRIKAMAGDVTDAGFRKKVRHWINENWGALDILVNNAGINIRKPPQDYVMEEWHRVLNINLTSLFVACQTAYPHLKVRGGKIINIGSMMSIFGASFAAPYGASKGGVVQLTKSLASAWAGENIQVNAVLPGWIDTELTKGARQQVSGLNEKVLARTPAARWGTPDDMAGIAVFLASPASDFITGTAIPVDGGYSAQG